MWILKKIDSNLIDITNPKLNFYLGFERDRPDKFIMMFLNLNSDLKEIIKIVQNTSNEVPVYDNIDFENNKLNWEIIRYCSEYIGPISDFYCEFHTYNNLFNKIPTKISDYKSYLDCEMDYLILIRNYLIKFRSLYEVIEKIFAICFGSNFNKNPSKKECFKGNSVIFNKIKVIKEFANYSIHFETSYTESKSKIKIEGLLKELKDSFDFPVLNEKNELFYESFLEKLLEYQKEITVHISECFKTWELFFKI
jgi:hypothetical protein